MFSSFFSTSAPVDPDAPTFHPTSSAVSLGEAFGALQAKDTEWLCSTSGFIAETQTFYTIGQDGTFMMCQVIHSSVGLWYPTIQFNCKIYNPTTKATTWKSINVSNFVTPPPGHDKHSCKADEFSITYVNAPESEFPEKYTIRANVAADLQISLEVCRPTAIPGYKVGAGEKGGYSYFGPDSSKPEGYVIHRFWPRYYATGHIIRSGAAEAIQGPGLFVHAIQGMRPNLVASSWDFVHFQSIDKGISATQMQFKTLNTYGRKGSENPGGVVVNVGSLVVDDKLVAVTAETRWPDEELSADAPMKSRATHSKTFFDADTTYDAPSEFDFEWAGTSLLADAPGSFTAKLHLDVGDNDAPKGLVEKVDFMAEIPKVIKMAVSYVAGTKPYIYQWLNPSKLVVNTPTESVEVEGTVYNEATFISAES